MTVVNLSLSLSLSPLSPSLILPLLPLDTYRELYAFNFTPSSDGFVQSSGWNLYDPTVEYSRMGVPNEYWSCTELNKDYEASTCTVKLVVLSCVLQLCETYSSTLFVPAKAEKSVVLGSAKFRSKGRLPVLSYYCQAKNVSEDI